MTLLLFLLLLLLGIHDKVCLVKKSRSSQVRLGRRRRRRHHHRHRSHFEMKGGRARGWVPIKKFNLA